MSDLNKDKIAITPGGDEDYEKAGVGSHHHHEVSAPGVGQGLYDPYKESVWTRLGLTFESFKKAPGTTGGQTIEGNVSNAELLHYENPMLQQKMKDRHLQMIAVGGSIGTGLFIGSGASLATGGPAALIIDWILIGFAALMTVQAIGEMAILYPLSGGFYALAVRMLDPAWGFAMGWNYVLQWAVTLPIEITAAGIAVSYWPAAQNVPLAAWITIFFVAIILINVFGTLGYAEEEFWSSCLKLLVVIIFCFIAVVCVCGGGPSGGAYGEYVGGRYWSNPGAFANGFKGVCSVFVTAAFSFGGTELVGLAASETPSPRKTVPSAIKNTFWRITIIYILSLLMIGLLVPYTDEFLLTSGSTAAASPFVRVLDLAHIGGINHLINVTICISVLSIGLSCVYGGSRTLSALAETGYAPKIFAFVDKSGRPLWSVIFILAFGPLAYVNLSAASGEVFAWLVGISGLSTLFTWATILLCHIRFRKAWQVQGHSLEELPFRAMFGAWGSWAGFILIILVLIAQAYIAISPVGGMSSDPKAVAKAFFEAYLALPICVLCYVAGYVWKRTTPQRAHEIDLDTGRKCWYTVEEMRAYRAELAAQPWYKRTYRFLFSG